MMGGGRCTIKRLFFGSGSLGRFVLLRLQGTRKRVNFTRTYTLF